MGACDALCYILLGAVLGAVGQSIRVIVGLKKKFDEASLEGKPVKDWFELRHLLVSLLIAFVIGSIAGVLGVLDLFGKEITKETLVALIAIGYSGTDFIEGFMKTKIPAK